MKILWLQSAGCGGCSTSLLCAEGPDVFDTLGGAGIEFLWYPTLSEATGGEVLRLLNAVESGDIALDVLAVDGSILTGPKGTGRFHMLSGTDRSMLDRVQALARRTQHVMAVGNCATYGCVTSAGGTRPLRWACNTLAIIWAGRFQRSFAAKEGCL